MSSTDDDGRLWWAVRARRRRAAQLSPDERFGRRFNAWALFGAGVWTVFLVPVAGDACGTTPRARRAGSSALLVFVAAYLSLFLLRRHHASQARRQRRVTASAAGFYALLLILATVVLLLVPPSGTACYVYVAVAGIFLFPMWVGAGQAVVLCRRHRAAGAHGARLERGGRDRAVGLSSPRSRCGGIAPGDGPQHGARRRQGRERAARWSARSATGWPGTCTTSSATR